MTVDLITDEALILYLGSCWMFELLIGGTGSRTLDLIWWFCRLGHQAEIPHYNPRLLFDSCCIFIGQLGPLFKAWTIQIWLILLNNYLTLK